MLTKDRNLIIVEMAIAYKVERPREFKFSVRNPILTLQQSIDSALREVVGSRTFDDMLAKADGRQKLVVDMRKQLQLVLKNYKTGIKITKISLKNLAPPDSVQEAYVDANRANNDAQAEIEKAQKEKERSIRLAQGFADQIMEKAKAYKAEVVEKARGKAKAFTAILKEYETAPEVTRTRLYIKMMEKKFGDSNKIFVKIKSGNALMYIPLDKYIQQSRQSTVK
jgi:membrane protease subunit HflK